MASEKEVVRMSGVLKGGGLEATCVVSAIKTTLPGVDSNLSHFDMVSVSRSLPDGVYVLLLPGQADIHLRQQHGHWLAASS